MGGRITRENALEFLAAALIRAVKTAAQTAAALLSPALAGQTVDAKQVLAAALLAGGYSLLTSLATGLPEVAGKQEESAG